MAIGRKALGKSSLPQPVRDAYQWCNTNIGRLDSSSRTLPNFLVGGTQRGGTTSLFIYLLNHELVFGPRRAKGVHYFDTNAHRSTNWYRAHFPRNATLAKLEAEHGARPAVGEGAPYYMFHPTIADRAADLLPGCRLLLVLREPLDRAISHHNHEVKRGFETLPLTEAFDAEAGRLDGARQQLLTDPLAVSKPHIHHAYLSRGQYAEQIDRCFAAFGREQVLVLDSADLKQEPEKTVRRATDFLGLPPMSEADYPLYNQRDRDPVSEELRERYGHVFDDSNKRLRELLPGALSWL